MFHQEVNKQLKIIANQVNKKVQYKTMILLDV